MCDLESESQNGCVMYSVALDDIVTALVPNLGSPHMFSSNYTSYFRGETKKIDMAKKVGMVKLHFHFIIAWGLQPPQPHPWIQPCPHNSGNWFCHKVSG